MSGGGATPHGIAADGVTPEDLALAHRMADRAAEVALPFFGAASKSTIKSDGSPVGEADLAVERELLAALASERPDDAILSEESGTHGHGGRRWIIDPIDGTVPFLAGNPEWGTHIALEVAGEIALAVVTRPTDGRRWWAVKGDGAYVRPAAGARDQPLELTSVADLDSATVSGWRPDDGERFAPLAALRWRDVPLNDLTAVLDGRADVMIIPGRPWDHAPFLLLLEEAGGSFIDTEGGRRIDIGPALYTNGRLDEAIRRLLWPA